LIYRQLNAVQ